MTKWRTHPGGKFTKEYIGAHFGSTLSRTVTSHMVSNLRGTSATAHVENYQGPLGETRVGVSLNNQNIPLESQNTTEYSTVIFRTYFHGDGHF